MAQILNMARLYLSRDFDPAIADYAPRFAGKIDLVAEAGINPAAYTKKSHPDLKGVVVWHVGNAEIVAAARQIADQTGAELIWADPGAVQQETLSIIRFIYTLFSQIKMGRMVTDSYAVFNTRLRTWKGRPISAFGNGPSLGQVVQSQFDPGPALRAVCNSTIADEAALAHLKPELLFCGDPVQHCGTSLYAGRFRQDLARALQDPMRVVFT